MPKKVMVLSAVAGLLVFGFAGQIAGSATTAKGLARHPRDLDSLRMLNARARSAALTSGINVSKVIQQARHGSKLGSLPAADTGPFGGEKMPAPTVVPSPDANNQTYASVAFDGTNYLVVWQDDRNYHSYIYGVRVKPDGTVLDLNGGIQISSPDPDKDDGHPSVAFDGTNYLVVWQDSWAGNSNIIGARVTPAGGVLDPSGITISDAEYYQQHPSVAFDRTNYLVVWEDMRSGNAWDIYGGRVTTGGAPEDGNGFMISGADYDQTSPSVAFDGTDYLVAWQDYRSNSTWDIYGDRVTTGGAPEDGNGFMISGADYGQVRILL